MRLDVGLAARPTRSLRRGEVTMVWSGPDHGCERGAFADDQNRKHIKGTPAIAKAICVSQKFQGVGEGVVFLPIRAAQQPPPPKESKISHENLSSLLCHRCWFALGRSCFRRHTSLQQQDHANRFTRACFGSHLRWHLSQLEEWFATKWPHGGASRQDEPHGCV